MKLGEIYNTQGSPMTWSILRASEECCGREKNSPDSGTWTLDQELEEYSNEYEDGSLRRDLNVPAGSPSCTSPYFPSSWANAHTLSPILLGRGASLAV